MKIAITANGKDLDSDIDTRFGRCSYFVIVDPDTMSFDCVSNESATASGGAGIQAAQTIAKAGVQAVITGNVGPNAYQTLTAAGIRIFIGSNGKIKDIISRYKEGKLKETNSASVNSHFGMQRRS